MLFSGAADWRVWMPSLAMEGEKERTDRLDLLTLALKSWLRDSAAVV